MKRLATVTFLLIYVCSCATSEYNAPIVDIQILPKADMNNHIVTPGETLYSIAMTYDLDYRILAKINGLSDSYAIVPGQRLSLKAEGNPKTSESTQQVTESLNVVKDKLVKVANEVVKRFKKTTAKPVEKPLKSEYSAAIKWAWPIKGKVLVPFKGNNGLNKGIDIRGKLGESIYAAASGEVIYAGSGLRDYGKLIILKHGEEFLSAYAHNRVLDVVEGDTVKTGDKIAEIGYSGSTQTAKLHFEIRVRGKPVDPKKYLPTL